MNDALKNKKKIKILFYIHSFIKFGGAERVLITIIQKLDREIFDIYLIMAQNEGEYLSEIPKDINLIILNKYRTIYSIQKIAVLIKKIKPHIFFHIRSLILGLFSIYFRIQSKKTKFVVREVIIPSLHNETETFPFLYNLGYKLIYPLFHKIICQSDDMINDLTNNYKIKNEKIVKIHNPIRNIKYNEELKVNKRKLLSDTKTINLLAIGRLTNQKGFDLLIESISYLDESFRLTILGDGKLKKELKSISIKNQVNDRVEFVGFVNNTADYFLTANYFILSSRYEGLPNVIIEAMHFGLPVIALNCLGGINEIVVPGLNGLIVKYRSPKHLADTITAATKINFDKDKIIESVKNKFNINDRIKDYENFFISICDK